MLCRNPTETDYFESQLFRFQVLLVVLNTVSPQGQRLDANLF